MSVSNKECCSLGYCLIHLSRWLEEQVRACVYLFNLVSRATWGRVVCQENSVCRLSGPNFLTQFFTLLLSGGSQLITLRKVRFVQLRKTH